MNLNTIESPLLRADAVWDMDSLLGGWQYPYELEPTGDIHFEKLTGDEFSASLDRGLDGFVCRFENSCLSLNQYRAAALRPKSNCFSIYMRMKLNDKSQVSLISSDFFGLAIHNSGYICAFLSQEIYTGITYREIPLAHIDINGWCDLIIIVAENVLRFYMNGELKCTVPVLWNIKPGFFDDFVIGGRKCCKPDTYGTTIPESRMNGLIDAVAIWQDALTEQEIAVLSGCERLTKADFTDEIATVCSAYNAFFDASVHKDIEKCNELHKIMRKIAVKDDTRPLFHLTQPFGAIFDPVGAFFYEGKYHIFSYHNINYLLQYSSLDHYVSEDLVHWTQWPIGPFADSKEDVFCIYLLNHIINTDGTLRALYTGQGYNGKCGVISRSNDGMITYTDKKEVLCRYHHDGHVFRHGDRWYTITSRLCKGRRPNGKGDPIMMYSSPDLENWVEEGEIFSQPKTPQNPSGFLEFPYLLFFKDKAVLLVGGDIRYFVGVFDWETKKFIPDKPQGIRLDAINPFYCFNPMCVDNKGENGEERRIIMGLYPNVQYQANSIIPWSGSHTMPRVLSFDGQHLKQEPISEIQQLRGTCHLREKIFLNEGGRFLLKEGLPPFLEIEATILPQFDGEFGISLTCGDDEILVVYCANQHKYKVCGKVLEEGESPTYLLERDKIKLRVFLDRRIIEVYVNGQVCTTAAAALSPNLFKVGIIALKGKANCERFQVWEIKTDKDS